MKATTLAVCIPNNKDCDKNCPYCISRMTWCPDYDINQWCENLELAKAFAERAGVQDVIVTGKGEPTLDLGSCTVVAKIFSEFPVYLQTNGIQLMGGYGWDVVNGIQGVAVSVDDPKDIDALTCSTVRMRGRILRWTVLLTEQCLSLPFLDWMKLARKHGVDQLSFRSVTAPPNPIDTIESKRTFDWIKANRNSAKEAEWLHLMRLRLIHCEMIRKLPYGAQIYDVDGIGVVHFPYCIQDSHGEDDIRSLIYHQDGHMYTTWNSPASILF